MRFPETIVQSYPYPLAVAAKRFNDATEHVEQFMCLAHLVEVTLKYLAAVAVVQYLRDEHVVPALQDALRKLTRPTLGHWNELLRVNLQYYREYSEAPHAIPELPEVYYAKFGAGKPQDTTILEGYHFVGEYLGRKSDAERSRISQQNFWDLLISYRNKTWGHGILRLDVDTCEEHTRRLQPAVMGILQKLEFLPRYPLRYVHAVNMERGQCSHIMYGYMGIAPAKEAPYVGEYRREKRLYLFDPTGNPLLSLHPLLIVRQKGLFILEFNERNQRIAFTDCLTGDEYAPETMTDVRITKLADDRHGKLGDIELPVPMEDPPAEVPVFETEMKVDELIGALDNHGLTVLQIALGESLRIGHFWLGLEFLLMSLSKQEGDLLPVALAEIGVDPGRLRGALRGLVGVQPEMEKTWRHQDAKAIGAEGWSLLQEIDPATLAADCAASKAPKAGVTPRMLAVWREAVRLTGEGKVGPDHLLLAALQHPQSLAVNLLLGHVVQAGHDPAEWTARLLRRAGGARAEEALDGASEGVTPQGAIRKEAPEHAVPEGDARVAVRPPGHDASLLNQLGRNLTALAKANQLRPAIGEAARRAMGQMGEILLQAEGNNPILLGDPGVGKTAIVEGFAWRLANDPKVVTQLAGRRIIDLSPTALLAGTKYRGDLEQRLQQVLAEMSTARGKTIVFIDEIHTILGGKAEGGLGAISDALKPALSRGEFPCIGATTVAEYRRYIEGDPALARRFTPVWIEEPSEEEAFQIAKSVTQEHLAQRHGVAYPDETVQEAVRLAVRYLHDEFLPGKAIKLLDQAGPRVILGGSLSGPEPGKTSVGSGEVTVEAVRAIVAERTGIPLTRLSEDNRTRLKNLEARLNERVKGQDQAVQAVVTAVKRARTGLGNPLRPQGVFLFAGPTGVGKTELALALAEALFDDEKAILRLDMSEYLEKHQVSRLIGSPPGYIGYEEEGQLTGRLRRRPYSVVLLDEIEKAHPDVQHLFLQLFDAGRLTDSRGRLADGRNAIFVMTTNLGTREAVSFINQPETYEQKVQKAIEDYFTPEFRNRIQRIITFRPVSQDMLEAIFDKLFARAAARFQAQDVEVTVDPKLRADLCRRYVGNKEGARPLERAIEDEIVTPLVDKLLDGEIAPGQRVVVGHGKALTTSVLRKPDDRPTAGPSANDLPPAEDGEDSIGLDPREVRNRAVLASRLQALNQELQAKNISVTPEESAIELLCSPFGQDQRHGLDTAAAFAELVEKPLLQRVRAGEFLADERVEVFRNPDLAIAFRKLAGSKE